MSRLARLSLCCAVLCLTLGACVQGDTPAPAGAADGAAGASAPAAPTPAADGAPPDAAKSAAPEVTAAAPEAAPLAAMLDIAGVACQRSESGIQTCTAPGFDISGADRACSADDTGFGVVSEEGATLLDRYPEDGATAIATLPKGQFLCVQFVAESTSGGDGWAYVTAIAPTMVSACAGNPLCGSAGLAPVWAGATPPGACAVGPEGRYTVGCPAGWLPRAMLDEFSMGL